MTVLKRFADDCLDRGNQRPQTSRAPRQAAGQRNQKSVVVPARGALLRSDLREIADVLEVK